MRFGVFLMGSRGAGYRDVLDQAERAEALGFHRIVLAERHFTHEPLLCASPLAVAAAVAARTRHVRIGLAGRVLALDHPLHVAEDAATVDVLSDGRLDFGVVRASLDDEAHRIFGVAREDAEGRFQEALEIILAAWTSESLAHSGRYFSFPEIAVFPRPVQRPRPPVFVVAVSDHRLDWAAQHGHGAVIGALRPPQAVAAAVERFRAQLTAAGHETGAAELQVNRFVHVAETDEAARDALRRPFTEFMERRAPDLRAALEASYGSLPSFEQMVDDFLLAGSPETVLERLRELRDSAGVSSLLATFSFVTVPHDRCVSSMELFAREVMPALAPAAEPVAAARE